MTQPQPQKRRVPTPIKPEQRAKLAQRATQQHASSRGYAIEPARRDDYNRAYARLLKRGTPRTAIIEELRPIYEVKP